MRVKPFGKIPILGTSYGERTFLGIQELLACKFLFYPVSGSSLPEMVIDLRSFLSCTSKPGTFSQAFSMIDCFFFIAYNVEYLE